MQKCHPLASDPSAGMAGVSFFGAMVRECDGGMMAPQ
jgi:hypothetical protein